MATKLQIYNKALIRLGQVVVTQAQIDDDSNNTARVCNAIYDTVLEEVTAAGPEKGWKFASWEISSVDVDSASITAFADYDGTASGTVLATAASHGLVSGDLATIKDGSVGSYNNDYTITRVNDDTFHFTATWVSTETATVQWTSQKLAYRFARPTCLRVKAVNVGGAELTDWIRKGIWILTNLESSEVDIDYVQSITDTTLFPSHFVKVLYMSLAVELAYNLIQSATAAERLILELEEKILPKAISIDEQERYVEEENNDWVNAGRTD